MIHSFTVQNQQLLETTDNHESFWLHVEQPTHEEIQQLIATYKFPKDYLTAVLDDAENSRSEGLHQTTLKKSILLLLQFPYKSISPSGYLQFETFPLSIIVTPNRQIITVTNKSLPFLEELKKRPFLQNDMNNKMNVLLGVLWQVVTTFNRYLDLLKKELDDLEQQIQVSTENKQLFQIMNIQKSLVLFDAATTANLVTLSELEKTAFIQENHAYHNHLHDVVVETKQATTSANIHLKFATQMNNTFTSVVSNNLNNVMKILTSLTIVLTIPTIIGGVFGMNVALPFAKSENAFLIITGITIFLCYLVIRILKKKNLL